MDLFGLVDLVTISGRKYALVPVDDYTSYTQTIFMKRKNETMKIMPKLMKLIQKEKSMSIVKIKFGHGREFVNYVIRMYCEINGIQHQLLVVETSQQNGVTERKNRTLKETSKTMIIEAGLPKKVLG